MVGNEKIYFDEGDVKVTKARFIVPAQTYAMSGITSVKSIVDQPFKGPAILAILGGLFIFFIAQTASIITGLVLIAGAALWFIKGKKHIVILSSASGEAEALSSNNSGFIERIISALNDAIVERG